MTWRALSISPYFVAHAPSPEEMEVLQDEVLELRRRVQVGRCRLMVSKPVLKAPKVSALEATI
jgi:hypothetical protein